MPIASIGQGRQSRVQKQYGSALDATREQAVAHHIATVNLAIAFLEYHEAELEHEDAKKLCERPASTTLNDYRLAQRDRAGRL